MQGWAGQGISYRSSRGLEFDGTGSASLSFNLYYHRQSGIEPVTYISHRIMLQGSVFPSLLLGHTFQTAPLGGTSHQEYLGHADYTSEQVKEYLDHTG